MKRLPSILTAFMFVAAGGQAFATIAQPVPIPEEQSTAPQIELTGVGIATAGTGNTPEHGNDTFFNFSDSSLLFGAAQRLYDQGIGSFSFGAVTTDAANRGTGSDSAYFIHQAVLSYQTDSFEMAVGRTDNQNSHFIDFPLLRGDDLVTLTNPVNPYSNGVNREEHRYANVAAVTFNQKLTYFENFHAQHLINSAGVGSDSGFNSYGASFQFMAPPGLEMFSCVPLYGFGYEYLPLTQNSPSGLNQVYGGAVVNLRKSMTGLLDLRLQDVASLGSSRSTLSTVADSYQADSNSLAASIRYLNQPFGQAGYQVSLTAAYKNYFRVSGANTVGGALTGVKKLGAGYSLIAQYQGQWRDTNLAAVQSRSLGFENVFEVGLLFNFDSVFNQHISPRRSLLNQQYQYIPN